MIKNLKIMEIRCPAVIGISLLVIMFVSGCNDDLKSSTDTRKRIAAEMDSAMNQQLDIWYPLAVDSSYGGFLSRFSYNWKPVGTQDKMIVTQARHTWTISEAGLKNPDNKKYRIYAEHGFDFLQNVMWDDQNGGFYTLVSQKGKVKPNESEEIIKTAYGNAFGIYALASYYKFTRDSLALAFAKKAFRWLDTHSYDPVHKGYFQFLSKEGTPYKEGYGSTPPKDQNSSIHLLEAFTTLYSVWPDPLVKNRLSELFILIRDTLTTDQGYLHLFFKADWTPISYHASDPGELKKQYNLDHVSFGHDIETGFLLLEAAHTLGLKDQAVMRKAKKMVDHTIENGWDSDIGGVYDSGYYFKGDDKLTVINKNKVWWTQAEAMHSLLIMADYFPDDSHNYFQKFTKQWDYIRKYMFDHKYGGWYEDGIDLEPEMKKHLKGHIWKGNYHTIRALLSCIERLQS